MWIFRSIRKFYGNLRLQSKFTLSLVMAVTIPVLTMGIFFYGKLYDMVVSYTLRQSQDTMAKTSPLIDDLVDEISNSASDIAKQPFYSLLFYQPIRQPVANLARLEEAVEFHDKIETLIETTPVTAVRLYIDIPDTSFSLFTADNTRDLFQPVSKIRSTYWYGIFQGQKPSELFCPPFYLGSREKENCGDLAYIRTLSFYYYGFSYKAYLALYYSSDSLTEILTENLAAEGGVSYIVNERDNAVASSDISLAGIYWLDYNTIEQSFGASKSFIEKNIGNNRVYAGFYRINKPGWFMVTVLPSTPLMEQSNQIMIQYVLLYLVFLLIALFLVSVSSRSITGRISSVILQMRKVRQGPPVPMESPVYHDEVGDLIDTYNYMTQKMNELLDNQARAAEDLRIAEFNSLQAQINPHFLYNTMDMINWMAQQGKTAEISNAVQNLSRFYKLTLSQKGGISTISQEEEHVSIYIRLQNMRYHNKIEFISDIPDELSEYSIPKLTLQPVIENAILHGILEKPSKSGTIVLTGWMEDEDMILLISDDGVGIPQEKLDTILTGKGQSSSGGTNIAIYNTHRRLQILYGEKYGLSYSSTVGKGTEVEIRLPAQK